MSGWTRIEEIQIWQLAHEICQDIWEITRRPDFRKDPGLRTQMLNSSGSMMDNVAEGFERGSNGEFRSFLGYAKGSSGELRSQLIRANDRGFITVEELEGIGAKVIQFSKQSKTLIDRLKTGHHRGFRLGR